MRNNLLHILSLTILVIFASCEDRDDSGIYNQSYVLAGDSSINQGLLISKEYSDGNRIWGANIDIDNDGLIDISISRYAESSNNADSYIILYAGADIEFASSSEYLTHFDSIIPFEYDLYQYIGESGVGKEEPDIENYENMDWVYSFQLYERISSLNKWTTSDCIAYLFFKRDQVQRNWTFDALDSGYIGFRKVSAIDMIYGWVNSSFDKYDTSVKFN